MTIYCIPGFGVDEKIFEHLQLDARPEFINWLLPLPGETIAAYARRMATRIAEEDPVILGVSFGGMIALEIARQRPVKQIILVSSVKSRAELPRRLRMIGALGLNRIFPVKKIPQNRRYFAAANRRLGAFTPQEQAFANAYRRSAHIDYVNWSFEQILNWKNSEWPADTIHIHGDADKIFPIKTIQPTHIVRGGTHMMVWNRADEISRLINGVLRSL